MVTKGKKVFESSKKIEFKLLFTSLKGMSGLYFLSK